MLANLMTPGGRLGYITVAVAALLATAGIVGIVLGASGVGIDDDGERIGATVVGLVALLGPAGLTLQAQRPLLGGVLAVLGSVAGALLNSWLIFPVLVVPVTLAITILRARKLSRHDSAGAARGAVSG